jgi:hypothetical protein
VRSLPRDLDYLGRYFKDEVARGKHPLDINDVWPENYSANSAQKVWAVKFASRHPNVALLDLSSFKCGHDAPTYGIVENIVSSAGTPYAALHDLDANKPGGSIKIRVKTYAHSLKLHEEALDDNARKRVELMLSVDRKRLELLERKREVLAQRSQRDPGLEQQIDDLGKRLAAYVPPVRPKEAPAGLIQLKKKKADGTFVTVDSTPHSHNA